MHRDQYGTLQWFRRFFGVCSLVYRWPAAILEIGRVRATSNVHWSWLVFPKWVCCLLSPPKSICRAKIGWMPDALNLFKLCSQIASSTIMDAPSITKEYAKRSRSFYSIKSPNKRQSTMNDISYSNPNPYSPPWFPWMDYWKRQTVATVS